MKIAIFGDSYSSTYGYGGVKPYPSWSLMLSENYDVRNFSENGSSLYYMKLLFDKHQQDFDKIIFLYADSYYFTDTLKNNILEVISLNKNNTEWRTTELRISDIKIDLSE
jgi:hypothetical protein